MERVKASYNRYSQNTGSELERFGRTHNVPQKIFERMAI